MTQLTRRTPRTCVSLLLVLSLLGLGAVDAAICWGADGHLSIETRFNSCCRGEAPEVPSPATPDLNDPVAMEAAIDGAVCVDTPLIQGAPAARTHDIDAGYLGQSTPVSYAVRPDLAPRGTDPASGVGSSLRRLRTTTLLI